MTFDRVIADLSNWSKGEPCGMIAYEGSAVAADGYCDNVGDFKQFLEEHSESLGLGTVLVIQIDPDDLTFVSKAVGEINACFKGIVEEKKEGGAR